MDGITEGLDYKTFRREKRKKWLTTMAAYLFSMVATIPLYFKYRGATQSNLRVYTENLALIAAAVLTNKTLDSGAFVECGTWKGGTAAGMVEIGGKKRRYYFFDSFEGLPPAKDIDGEAAKRWQADTASPIYYDNCAASLEEFNRVMAKTSAPPGAVTAVKGFFEKTLPGFTCPPLAVLRLDGDWYESTMTCLDNLWDRVMPGGLILIDDYYAWEGCAKAVHDFLSKRKARERIYQGPIGRVAFIVKKD